MALASQVFGNSLVLNVTGRLDQDNCENFRRDLAPHLLAATQGALTIVLDLSELEYVSSAGLRCFMLAAKETKSHDGRIFVAALQPMVAEIFQISRFDLLIPVYLTLRAALESVSADAVSAFDRR
jgi:anti-anti-sigma factor